MPSTCEKLCGLDFAGERAACRPPETKPSVRIAVRHEVATAAEEERLQWVACFQRFGQVRRRAASLRLWSQGGVSSAGTKLA